MFFRLVNILPIVALGAAALVIVAAAAHDARHYRIPNALSLSLSALFPVFVLVSPHNIDWKNHALVGALMLAVGIVLYIGHLAGAGDAKLLAAAGLWAGPQQAGPYLMTTALAGGALALAYILCLRLRPARRGNRSVTKTPIPYGIAIAAGGLQTFYHLSQPLLSPS